MNKKNQFPFLYCTLVIIFFKNLPFAYGFNEIIRPYLSVRNSSMGNVRITTGLYDENFFNNPARVTANPESKLTLIQITPIETTPETFQVISDALNDPLKALTQNTGKNLHYAHQIVLPAYYLAAHEERTFAFAIGFLSRLQINTNVRKNYQAYLQAIEDLGPAITVGKKFLANGNLSFGFTGHLMYRVNLQPELSLTQYIQNSSLTLQELGREGSTFDFDIGTTYQIGQWLGFDWSFGAAIQNLLGGQYSRLNFKPLKLNQLPLQQPRTLGWGVSAIRPSWFILKDTSFAFEMTDIHNNSQDSVFKLLHLGAETHFSVLALRCGMNQGYLTLGAGIDLTFLTIDVGTYTEELGLNTGILPDQRVAVTVGIQI